MACRPLTEYKWWNLSFQPFPKQIVCYLYDIMVNIHPVRRLPPQVMHMRSAASHTCPRSFSGVFHDHRTPWIYLQHGRLAAPAAIFIYLFICILVVTSCNNRHVQIYTYYQTTITIKYKIDTLTIPNIQKKKIYYPIKIPSQYSKLTSFKVQKFFNCVKCIMYMKSFHFFLKTFITG